MTDKDIAGLREQVEKLATIADQWDAYADGVGNGERKSLARICAGQIKPVILKLEQALAALASPAELQDGYYRVIAGYLTFLGADKDVIARDVSIASHAGEQGLCSECALHGPGVNHSGPCRYRLAPQGWHCGCFDTACDLRGYCVNKNCSQYDAKRIPRHMRGSRTGLYKRLAIPAPQPSAPPAEECNCGEVAKEYCNVHGDLVGAGRRELGSDAVGRKSSGLESGSHKSAPPAAFTRVWGDAPDHIGEHNENSFCRQAGCTTAAPSAGEHNAIAPITHKRWNEALQAHLKDWPSLGYCEWNCTTMAGMTEFVELVREAGRQAMVKELAKWMIEHSFATGHGQTFTDLLKELSWQIAELREAGRLAGMEEAAKWCENERDTYSDGTTPGLTARGAMMYAASQIRAAATQRKGTPIVREGGK